MSEPYISNPILVARATAAAPTVFTTIAQLKNIPLPKLNSNEADGSVQNSTIDKYVMSTLMRRDPVTLTLNMMPYDATHDHLTGLLKAKIDCTLDGYRFSHAASSLIWVASGYVKAFEPKTPSEQIMEVDITLRFTGQMTIQGITVGT